MYLLLFNITKMILKSLSITHLHNFDCRITNNPPYNIYLHLIGLTISDGFLKGCLHALIRINNNRVNFRIMSPNKIQGMPYS